VIELNDITKRYGATVAVRDLTFSVKPGVVTGFLGPNGAGKSTTMRLILGLDTPDSGQALVNGKHYREHLAPLAEVGALLEARSLHPGRIRAAGRRGPGRTKRARQDEDTKGNIRLIVAV
jgi:ABC-2 type transport system ATP-binding protein